MGADPDTVASFCFFFSPVFYGNKETLWEENRTLETNSLRDSLCLMWVPNQTKPFRCSILRGRVLNVFVTLKARRTFLNFLQLHFLLHFHLFLQWNRLSDDSYFNQAVMNCSNAVAPDTLSSRETQAYSWCGHYAIATGAKNGRLSKYVVVLWSW